MTISAVFPRSISASVFTVHLASYSDTPVSISLLHYSASPQLLLPCKSADLLEVSPCPEKSPCHLHPKPRCRALSITVRTPEHFSLFHVKLRIIPNVLRISI